MFKNYYLIYVFILFLCSCGSDAVYKIEGKLANQEDPLVYIVYEGSGDRVMDSIVCVTPGKFTFETNQEGFNSATLFLENKTKHITVYLEPKQKTSISGDLGYPGLVQVKGGRINSKLSDFTKKTAALMKEQVDLTNTLNSKPESATGDTDLAAKLTNVNHEITEAAFNYISNNPKEEASAVLIQTYFVNPDDTRKLDELLNVLDPKLNDFFVVKELSEYNQRAKRTALGETAPDFSVKNIYGRPYTLDSISTAYKILAFIPPWSERCHTDILHLDKVVAKHDKKEVDILLLTLDYKPEIVREALKKDSINWNIIADSANQTVAMLDLYNVSALPRCFLLDENDKIILKTDNSAEIMHTLDTLMESQ